MASCVLVLGLAVWQIFPDPLRLIALRSAPWPEARLARPQLNFALEAAGFRLNVRGVAHNHSVSLTETDPPGSRTHRSGC